MNPLSSADPGAPASAVYRRSPYCALCVITVLMSMSCGQGQLGTGPGPVPGPGPGPGPGPIVRSTVLLAAGDIGFCGSQGAVDTGEMLDSQEGTIIAVGDLAYPHGSIQDYTMCYDPVWGR